MRECALTWRISSLPEPLGPQITPFLGLGEIWKKTFFHNHLRSSWENALGQPSPFGGFADVFLYIRTVPSSLKPKNIKNWLLTPYFRDAFLSSEKHQGSNRNLQNEFQTSKSTPSPSKSTKTTFYPFFHHISFIHTKSTDSISLKPLFNMPRFMPHNVQKEFWTYLTRFSLHIQKRWKNGGKISKNNSGYVHVCLSHATFFNFYHSNSPLTLQKT